MLVNIKPIPADATVLDLQAQPMQSCRVLVVDDEPEILKLVVGVLVRSGCEVDTAEDGLIAWEKLQIQRYDLLVTDNNMPRLDGIGLAGRLHSSRMELPVIFASGKNMTEELGRKPWLNIRAVLLKPYTIEMFLCVVSSALMSATAHRRQSGTQAGARGEA